MKIYNCRVFNFVKTKQQSFALSFKSNIVFPENTHTHYVYLYLFDFISAKNDCINNRLSSLNNTAMSYINIITKTRAAHPVLFYT